MAIMRDKFNSSLLQVLLLPWLSPLRLPAQLSRFPVKYGAAERRYRDYATQFKNEGGKT